MRRPLTRERLERFCTALGRVAQRAGRVYLCGGASAVLMGWRESTIDVDLLLDQGAESLLRVLPKLKEELELNVEIAGPPHFIPELPRWQDRCRFIVSSGPLAILHYDFYAQALAKIERGHQQDLADARAMLEAGVVDGSRLRELFEALEPELYRFPAIHPKAFRRALAEFLDG